MTDDDERIRQHWQELAEQLGLESEAEPPAVGKPAPRLTSQPPPPEPASKEAKKESWEEQERSSPAQHQSISDREPVAEESAPADWPVRDEVESQEERAPQSATEEAPRRRRGRRSEDQPRGSRTKNASAVSEPGPEEVSPPGETIDEKSAERGPRRRKGSPRRSRDEETPISAEEIGSEGPTVAAEPSDKDADKDDLDTLTDWNVPSWTELIDSLYRPDR
jgi:hypothetical protein